MNGLYAASVIGRLSAKDYRDYGWGVLVLAAVPRVLAEAAFLVLLGRVIGGDRGQQLALLGVVAYIVTVSTVARGVDVFLIDVEADAFDELRLGARRYLGVVVVRCWPWCVEGFAYAILTLVVVGPLVLGWAVAVRTLTLLPIVAVACVTTAAFGLAVNAVGLGRRVGGLMGTLGALVLLALCGVVTPAPRGWIGTVGAALPLTHAAQALRAGVAGGSVVRPLLLELAVGAAWAAAAVLAISWFLRRMYREGITP